MRASPPWSRRSAPVCPVCAPSLRTRVCGGAVAAPPGERRRPGAAAGRGPGGEGRVRRLRDEAFLERAEERLRQPIEFGGIHFDLIAGLQLQDSLIRDVLDDVVA